LIVAGLTGGIGSGKSTVSRFFQEMGAEIIDADEIAHWTIRRGSPVHRRVVERFGTQILNPEGEIDRKRLGRIVFDDPAARQELNQMIHPLVFEEARRRVADIRKRSPDAVVIFDVPLLIESGALREVDSVIVVWVDRETQIRRLVERDRFTEKEARKRLDAQLPLAEKLALANHVVDTSRPLPEVRSQVERIFGDLKQEGKEVRAKPPRAGRDPDAE